jgi:hypothetical protein
VSTLAGRRPLLREAFQAALRAAALPAPERLEGAGLALIEEILAQPRYAPPTENPYARLVAGLAAEAPAGLRAQLLLAMRPWLVTTFAYAVPSEAALARIATLGTLVEVGAGGGYWARCLAERGATVHAFDRLRPERQRRKGGDLVEHFPVRVGGPEEALAAVPDAAALLLCWPPGLTNRAEVDAGAPPLYSTMSLEALARFSGEHLVFVGDRTSSFGSPAFFNRLDQEWQSEERFALPHLGTWSDAAHVYRRR